MPDRLPTHIECIDPILRVEDMSVSVRYYVDVLGFEQAAWGTSDFTHVGRDGRGLYLCRGDQGNVGAWIWVGVGDVRALYHAYKERGAIIRQEPTKRPWAPETPIRIGPRGTLIACGSPWALRSAGKPESKRREQIMSTGTVRLHRVIRAPAKRIYRAFLNADAMAKWLPPNGFTGRVHHLDARVGGTFRMSFTNFTTEQSHSFGGEYLELIPNERLCYTDRFDDPNLPGAMKTTVSLRAVSCGTELTVVQEGIPEAIPVEACYLGWQESLVLLAKLVEAEIRE